MITAFYSFKGGVGRTLSVVHVARRLARALQRDDAGDVLVVDLDLEAPGLDPYLGGNARPSCGGLVRLLEAMRAKPAGARAAWLKKALRDPRYVVKHPTLPLRYLPSGLSTIRAPDAPGYSTVAAWLREAIDEPGGAQLAALREALSAAATYVLLDSRTGLADESYLSTVLLPDALVLLFRPSPLHLEGVEQVYRNFLARRGLAPGDPRAPVIPVVSPLPNRGGTDIARFLHKEVPRVFRWRWEGEPTVDQRLDAPLERFGARRFVRLYAEPAVELGETALVDEEGDWLPGFDAETPLPQGYERLVRRLRYANFREDWRGADWLAHHWDTTGEDALAGHYLVERLRQRFLAGDLAGFALGNDSLQSVVAPELAGLVASADAPAHLSGALAEVGATLVADAKVEGAALSRAVAWSALARSQDAAHLPVFSMAYRFRETVPTEVRTALAAAVPPLEGALAAVTGEDAASRAGLAALRWALNEPTLAAAHLLGVPGAVLATADEGVQAALSNGIVPAMGLGALPYAGRTWIASPPEDLVELCAFIGWRVWARHLAGDAADHAMVEARCTDLPGPAEPRPTATPNEAWLATLLRGGVPGKVPKGQRGGFPARFLAALQEQGGLEFYVPVANRAELGWHFAVYWARGALQLAATTPPTVAEPTVLSVAMTDALRMGLFAAAQEDEGLVTDANALLAEAVAVAPGLGVVVRRMDAGRAPLLAALHLEWQGRLTPTTCALVARLRATLDADVPVPEPPLDDLAGGYVLDADRLHAAAALVTTLPRRLLGLSERVQALGARTRG